MTTSPPEAGAGRAAIIGTGLIGGSLGLALRARGWYVTGRDRNAERSSRALELGALDAVGDDLAADVTFIATPVHAIVDEARKALAAGSIVTDVGSVKESVTSGISHAHFVGGHPMAGSEQEGVDGSDGELFEGATWVLTPTVDTDPVAYTRVRSIVTSLGADVVALPPHRHDALVAIVSHVPHLTAATLMRLAADRSEEHSSLLRLAAGGFRDMTRIAAGHPGIWPDICAQNRVAILEALDVLLERLSSVREVVAAGDRKKLLELLEDARAARVNLPTRAARAAELAELRVPVPDRPGVLADVTTLASDLGVSIQDLEIAHSAEGDAGVLVLLLEAADADRVRDALSDRGYRVAVRRLE